MILEEPTVLCALVVSSSAMQILLLLLCGEHGFSHSAHDQLSRAEARRQNTLDLSTPLKLLWLFQKGMGNPFRSFNSATPFGHRVNSPINLLQSDIVPFLLNSPAQLRRIENKSPILQPLFNCPPNRLNRVEIRGFRRV
jgi:hypothetical protein